MPLRVCRADLERLRSDGHELGLPPVGRRKARAAQRSPDRHLEAARRDGRLERERSPAGLHRLAGNSIERGFRKMARQGSRRCGLVELDAAEVEVPNSDVAEIDADLVGPVGAEGTESERLPTRTCRNVGTGAVRRHIEEFTSA